MIIFLDDYASCVADRTAPEDCRFIYPLLSTGDYILGYALAIALTALLGGILYFGFNEISKSLYGRPLYGSKRYTPLPGTRAYQRQFAHNRQHVIRRDHSICQSCGTRCSGTNRHVHHITRRADGGTNNLTNLITLCSNCHARAHGRRW